jgi:hypothetical protein
MTKYRAIWWALLAACLVQVCIDSFTPKMDPIGYVSLTEPTEHLER